MTSTPPRPSSRRAPATKYVRVAVNAGRVTSLTFSYSVPPGRTVVAGEVVHVPWGVRTLQGVIVEGPLDTSGYDPDEVRPLEPPIDAAPRIPPDRLPLAAWLRDYYLAPPWESYALFLPPGAGERPRIAVSRGTGAPSALSERQQAVYEALTDRPVDTEELKADLVARQSAKQPAVTARGFDAALGVLIRRGLAERHYTLAPARARPRVVEVVRLVVPPIGVVARRSTDTLAVGDPEVAAAIRSIREQATRGLGIAELVKESGLSRWQLEERFRRAVGRSIHDDMLRVRLEEARRLVTTTDLPMKSITPRAGLRSVAYMTTLFRRHFGIPPAAMRAASRGRASSSPLNPET